MFRPTFKPRLRWSRIVFPIVAIAGVVTTVTAIAVRPSPPPTIAITVPPAPPPTVSVGQPIVTVNVPPPPAPPVPEAPTPRPLAPHLDAGCIFPTAEGVEPSNACSWDDGFPAVSADGTLVAFRHVTMTPGEGAITDSFVELFETRTQKAVRDLPLMTEADLKGDRGRGYGRVVRQVEAAQAFLDTHHFKSMISLGSSRSDTPKTGIHAEFIDGRARIVDGAAVIWQGDPGVASLNGQHDPEKECSGWNLNNATLWWHPDAKVVFAEEMYFTGGCMCPDYDEYQSWRL